MSITSWHKKSSYGSFFNSTIGGLFFLLSIFYGLVQIRSLFYISRVVKSISVKREIRNNRIIAPMDTIIAATHLLLCFLYLKAPIIPKTRPIIGTKSEKANAKLIISGVFSGLTVGPEGQPHSGHIAALSTISFPQCAQSFIQSSPFKNCTYIGAIILYQGNIIMSRTLFLNKCKGKL